MVKVSVKNWDIILRTQGTYYKINLRVLAKPHVHLQSMVKTSVKIQKNRIKSVAGVAQPKLPTVNSRSLSECLKMTKFKLHNECPN